MNEWMYEWWLRLDNHDSNGDYIVMMVVMMIEMTIMIMEMIFVMIIMVIIMMITFAVSYMQHKIFSAFTDLSMPHWRMGTSTWTCMTHQY